MYLRWVTKYPCRRTWEDDCVPTRSASSVAYVLFIGLLWAIALPAVLVADAAGAWFPLRGPLEVTGAAALLGAGLVLIDVGARTLATAGVGLFSVRPGERLVTTGVYDRIRNPIDVGSLAIAASTWLALDLALGWVIPVGALVSSVASVGPYEDRLLLEVFGDEFSEYRSAVPKWRWRLR